MKTKQKVLLGLAGLTALAVAGGSVGTMAWFYSNTTVTASGLSMSVESPTSDLLIAKGHSTVADGGWSTSLSLSGTTTSLSPCSLCGTNVNPTSTGFDPGSVKDFYGHRHNNSSHYICEGGASGMVLAYYFVTPKSINADGTPSLPSGYSSWHNWNSSAMTVVTNSSSDCYFKEVDFQVKTGRSYKMEKGYVGGSLYLNTTVTVTGTYKPIYEALRFAVVKEPVSVAMEGAAFAGKVGFFDSLCDGSGFVSTPFNPLRLSGPHYDDTVTVSPMTCKLFYIVWLDGNDTHCTTSNLAGLSSITISVEHSLSWYGGSIGDGSF